MDYGKKQLMEKKVYFPVKEILLDNPDYQYCLPKYPPSGMGYLDFEYSIPHSKTLVISNNPQGIVKAVSSVYGVHPDHVSVYRIARHDVHVGIFLWFQ